MFSIGYTMSDQDRREALRQFVATTLKGDRSVLIERAGLSKGRVSQLLTGTGPFGERAARKLGERLNPYDPDFLNRTPLRTGVGAAERRIDYPSSIVPPSGVAQLVSLPAKDDVPELSWEIVLSEPLPERFMVRLVDAAMAPAYPPGTLVRFKRTTDLPRGGACIIVQDSTGARYFRRLRIGAGSSWEAAADNSRAYGPLAAEEHGLQVVAVMTGVDTDGADSL